MQEPIRYSVRRMARYGGPKARRAYQPGGSRAEVYRMKAQGQFEELPQFRNRVFVVFSAAAHGEYDVVVAETVGVSEPV